MFNLQKKNKFYIKLKCNSTTVEIEFKKKQNDECFKSLAKALKNDWCVFNNKKNYIKYITVRFFKKKR